MPGTAELLQICKKNPDLSANYQVATDPIPVNNDLLDVIRDEDVAWVLARLDLDAEPLYKATIRPQNQTVPSWSATNSVCFPGAISGKRIVFLPKLLYPVTQYDNEMYCMKRPFNNCG